MSRPIRFVPASLSSDILVHPKNENIAHVENLCTAVFLSPFEKSVIVTSQSRLPTVASSE